MFYESGACDFPLRERANIYLGNSLRMDWNSILPAEGCSYILGNPPFVGYSNHNDEQQKDRAELFGKVKTLDYVACWYKKAANYMADWPVRCAFVSTNSICQGQQVEPLWKPLFESGIHINFAYQSFEWSSEADIQAHVYVVIVGFSRITNKRCLLVKSDGSKEICSNINAYLYAGPNSFISKRAKPLSLVPCMNKGFQATDNGYLLMYEDEKDALLAQDPAVVGWIRPFSMGADFIKGDKRFCLWLPQATAKDIAEHPGIRERVEACRAWRSTQTPTGDAYKLKDTPHLLRPCNTFHDKTYIGIPKVSSSRRDYIPLGFINNGMIPGDMLYFVETNSVYDFGVMMSQFHNAWMRVVAGRLGMGYRYANTIVYNNFVWPNPTEDKRKIIEKTAQEILDVRLRYPGWTLADLYDPDKMPDDLRRAHLSNDAAVEQAYGVDFKGDEAQIIAHLFKLYEQKTNPNN